MGRKSRQKKENQEKKTFQARKETKGALETSLLFIIQGAAYLMLLTPLIVGTRYFFPYVGPKGLYLTALIELMVSVWLILIYIKPKYRPKKNIVLLAVFAYVLILILASVFGVDLIRSFWSKFERMSGLLMWLHLFGLFLVSSSVFKRKDWERLFLASLGVAVFVCFAFFAGPESHLTSKGGSTLGNSSFLATYLLFNIYFAIYLFFRFLKQARQEKDPYAVSKTVFAAVAFVFMFFVLSISGGQAAFVSCLGGFVLVFFFWLAVKAKSSVFRKLSKTALIIGFLVYFISVFLLLYPGTFVQDYYLNFRTRSRPLVWEMSWQGLKQRPVLGWGPQNFGIVFEKYFDPWFNAKEKPRFDQAHNIVMDTLADAGILGLLAYLSIFGSSIWIFWKKGLKHSFWIPAAFTAVLVGHFTQNLNVFDMPASFLMLFLVIGFAGSIAQERTEKKDILARPASPAIILLSIVLFSLCFTYFVYKPMLAGRGVIKVLTAQTIEQREEAHKQTLHTSPIGMYQIRNHLAGVLLKRAQKGDAYEQEFDFITKEMEKSIRTSSLDYDTHLALAKVYNAYAMLFDQTKLLRAEELLNRCLELSPTKQDAYWEMSKTQSLLGNPEKAISYAEQAVAIDPNLAYSHLFYVNILYIHNRQDLAIEKARQALEIVPEEQARRIEPSFKENLESIVGDLDKS